MPSSMAGSVSDPTIGKTHGLLTGRALHTLCVITRVSFSSKKKFLGAIKQKYLDEQ